MPPALPPEIISQKPPAVLVVMTINTQILPVGAVRGIVHAIAVFVVYSEEISVPEFKLSPALGADETVDPQGLLPVISGCTFL